MKGRAGKRPTNLTLMLWCRATPELTKQVDEIAEKEDRPRSWVIRQLLVRALETSGKEKLAS